MSAGTYVPRPRAETDRSLKQIIPYLVLRDGDRIFLMKRTSAGGDARLHDLYSVGVGGHLNPGDGGILGGLAREWREDSRPISCPTSRSSACSTMTRSMSASITWASCISRTRPVTGEGPRDAQVERLVRGDRGAFVPSTIEWRPGASSCSTRSSRPIAGRGRRVRAVGSGISE